MPQEGQKQVADILCNALISLVHFVQLRNKVNQRCVLYWMSVIYFYPLYGIPNHPVFFLIFRYLFPLFFYIKVIVHAVGNVYIVHIAHINYVI